MNNHWLTKKKLKIKEREKKLERRDGVGEDVDPGDLSGSGNLGIIRRESVRNGASPVVYFYWLRY